MKVPGSKITPGQESYVRTIERHRKIFKKIALQNNLAQMKFNMSHCLVDFYQDCLKGGPRVQNCPAAGVLVSKIKYT